MDSIFLLIPIAIVFTIVAVSAFFWAVNNKQYDDLDSESQRILFDDPVTSTSKPQTQPMSNEQSSKTHNNKPSPDKQLGAGDE